MPPTAWHTEHGWQLPYATTAICHYMPYATTCYSHMPLHAICHVVLYAAYKSQRYVHMSMDPHLSLISMYCTVYLQQPTTWRRTAVTERSLRDAARMGWRWNRQLHPRQLKGTSSRTRIIAGVLLSALQSPTILYICIMYYFP
jgi:hypothetical protein